MIGCFLLEQRVGDIRSLELWNMTNIDIGLPWSRTQPNVVLIVNL